MSTHDSDIVELVSMNRDEFRQFRKEAIQDYADGFIRDGLAAAKDAERKAEKEFDTYWPDGLADQEPAHLLRYRPHQSAASRRGTVRHRSSQARNQGGLAVRIRDL